MPRSRSSSQDSVVTRTVMLTSLLLTGIFIALFFLEHRLEGVLGNYADEATTGLMLLILWLVVGSGIRSINSLSRGIPIWKLLMAGVLMAAVSAVLFSAFLVVFPKVSKSTALPEVAGASGGIILVLMALAFVISLLAVIQVRISNKMLGNVLSFLIVISIIVGFVYFTNR